MDSAYFLLEIQSESYVSDDMRQPRCGPVDSTGLWRSNLWGLCLE
jgi:hypothetical protein